jgi:hypothetical protein
MTEYIEVTKILEYLDVMISALSYPLSELGEEAKAYIEGFKEARSVVERFPAADVAPAIHAHWAQTSKGVIYCSNCGAVCGIGAHIEEVTEDHYFCYYCGAKMDEEEGKDE